MIAQDSANMWDWAFALDALPRLVPAALPTVRIALLSSAVALVLGLVIALARRSRFSAVSRIVGFMVEFIRSTPLLVQLYFIFYVLPTYGLSLPAITVAVLGLGVHFSAYTSEVYRAGIEGVPSGQWEAATALSFRPLRTWFGIILPQAIRNALPALGNYVNMMFKETAIVAAITVLELLGTARLIGSQSFRYLEPMTLVGLIFLGVSYAGALGIRRLERKLSGRGGEPVWQLLSR